MTDYTAFRKRCLAQQLPAGVLTLNTSRGQAQAYGLVHSFPCPFVTASTKPT
jgi:hypothetical protein